MTSSVLMKAILAMDSYNRGYERGIELPAQLGITYLGNALITHQSNIALNSAEVNAGFYAVAYNYNGQSVISYRGTNAGNDAIYGWPAGVGVVGLAQTEPPPIKESRSGIIPDRVWATFRRLINGTEAFYGRADYRSSASG